jgi:hypothetical protein
MGATLWWIESPLELLIAITVLPDGVCEDLQLIMQTFMSTQGSSPVHQCGKHSLFVERVVVVVVGVGMEIEVSVCGLAVDCMAQ